MTDFLITLIVVAFAGARLWRLFAVDMILAKPRAALIRRTPGWVEDMIHCPWCLGTHLTILTGLVWVAADWSHPVIGIVAATYVAGVVGERT